MKVIYKMKNILNQESQVYLESRLIEVIIYETQMIQFVSTVNLIQMQLTKVIYNLKNSPIQEFQHSLESKLIEVMKAENNHEKIGKSRRYL
jgi:hypothetical protein